MIQLEFSWHVVFICKEPSKLIVQAFASRADSTLDPSVQHIRTSIATLRHKILVKRINSTSLGKVSHEDVICIHGS